MQILIPMAGRGSKFLEAGYETNQSALPVFDRHTGKKLPMVVCAVRDLPGIEENGKNLTFIDTYYHKENGVEERIKKFFPAARFMTLEQETAGQASTCLMAENIIKKDEELLIAGSDNGLICNIDYFNNMRYECDSIVFTYRNNESVLKNPDEYGWVKIDEDNCITNVFVKKHISDKPLNDHAIVSTFWFRKADMFFSAAKEMIRNNDRTNDEFYIDGVIKYLLFRKNLVKSFEINRYISWNNPSDYEEYQLTYNYWKEFLDNISDEDDIHPFTIGISGDSGSGKSTYLKIVESVIDKNNLLILEGDGDHKWEREDKNWDYFTHLNADANNLYEQADDLQMLKNGAAIKRREYNHETGRFTPKLLYVPKPYVVLCGLHSFYLSVNRRNLDLKIYMDIDDGLRRFWKIKRDTLERGHTYDEVVMQIEARKQDAKIYIEPQKEYADIRIRYFDPNLSESDCNYVVYKENIHVEIRPNKEDTLLGVLHRLIDFLPRIVKEVHWDGVALSFVENNVENIPIPISEICDAIGLDIKRFAVKDDNCFYGKDGIMALVLMAYIIDKSED